MAAPGRTALHPYQTEKRTRWIGFAAAALGHTALLYLILTYRDLLPPRLQAVLPATLIRQTIKPPPPPKLEPKNFVAKLELPDFKIEDHPAQPIHQLPLPTKPRFGPASGEGFAITLNTSNTGGAGSRAQMGDYDGDAKRRIAGARVIPHIPKEVRHSCVIEYTVVIDHAGHRLSYSIIPCTIDLINEAARRTLERVPQFEVPPKFSGPTYTLHGTLNYNLKVEE